MRRASVVTFRGIVAQVLPTRCAPEEPGYVGLLPAWVPSRDNPHLIAHSAVELACRASLDVQIIEMGTGTNGGSSKGSRKNVCRSFMPRHIALCVFTALRLVFSALVLTASGSFGILPVE
jgi:hypothetical protein